MEDFLEAQWLRLYHSAQGIWIQLLVRELRLHMTHGQKTKTLKKKKEKIRSNIVGNLKIGPH